uniref:Uncharacterized protein n=1 Tax=Globodera rostochiensis TaxID=31243 RepID=A0A914IA44_GLORO
MCYLTRKIAAKPHTRLRRQTSSSVSACSLLAVLLEVTFAQNEWPMALANAKANPQCLHCLRECNTDVIEASATKQQRDAGRHECIVRKCREQCATNVPITAGNAAEDSTRGVQQRRGETHALQQTNSQRAKLPQRSKPAEGETDEESPK